MGFDPQMLTVRVTVFIRVTPTRFLLRTALSDTTGAPRRCVLQPRPRRENRPPISPPDSQSRRSCSTDCSLPQQAPSPAFRVATRATAGYDSAQTRSQAGSVGASSREGGSQTVAASPAQSAASRQTVRLLARSQLAAQWVPSLRGVVQQRSPARQSVGRVQRNAALVPSCFRAWTSDAVAQRRLAAATTQ